MIVALCRSIGRSRIAAVLVGIIAIAAGCSSNQNAKEEPLNPVRNRIETAIAGLHSDEPVQMRYNPAACDCPAFEIRLANRWVRAVWTNANLPRFTTLRDRLVNSGPEKWPQAILAKAQVETEPVRTVQGVYAVRVEVARIVTSAGQERTPKAEDDAPSEPAVKATKDKEADASAEPEQPDSPKKQN